MEVSRWTSFDHIHQLYKHPIKLYKVEDIEQYEEDLPDDFIETKNEIKQVAVYEKLKPHLKEMYKEQNIKVTKKTKIIYNSMTKKNKKEESEKKYDYISWKDLKRERIIFESNNQENSYHEKVKTEWYDDDDEDDSDDENSRLRMLHATHSEIINMVREEQDNFNRRKNATILSPEEAELIKRKAKLAKLMNEPGFSSLYYKHLKRIKKQKRIARIAKNQSSAMVRERRLRFHRQDDVKSDECLSITRHSSAEEFDHINKTKRKKRKKHKRHKIIKSVSNDQSSAIEISKKKSSRKKSMKEIAEDVLKTLKKGEKVVSSRSKTKNPIITLDKVGSQKSYGRKSLSIGEKSSQNLPLLVVDEIKTPNQHKVISNHEVFVSRSTPHVLNRYFERNTKKSQGKNFLGLNNEQSPLKPSISMPLYDEIDARRDSVPLVYTVQDEKPVKRRTYHNKKSFDVAQEDLKNVFLAANKASNDQNLMIEAKSWRKKSVELRKQIRALQALQNSHEKKESHLKIYGGVIQSVEAEKEYSDFQASILDLLQGESTVSLIKESGSRNSYDTVNVNTREMGSKELINNFSVLDKKIIELKKKWAVEQSSTEKKRKSKKRRRKSSFIRINRTYAKLSKPEYYVQKYKKLYRNLQKQMVKKVAHMAVKYDLKAFVEHNDKGEKKNTYSTAKKSFNRDATQRSFRKLSMISSFRSRSNDVTRSSINFSLTRDPLDGKKLSENVKLPPVDASKGLWVLPEQNKASSEKEAEVQKRQKKVARWLSEKINGLVKKKELEQELAKKNNHTRKTFVRYYGDSRREQLMKYYQRKPGKGTYKSDLLKLTSEENSDKLMIQLADGSVTVHYPKSENVAIVASPVIANPHQLYVNCFDRDQQRTCLATFSPNGKSCCYRKNGSLGLILNEEGGLIKQDPYDETYDKKIVSEGKEENKSWLWPANNDQVLEKPLIYRLNKEMHLKISGKHDIVLFFTCERECVKIQIGSHANLKQENKSTEKQTKTKRKIKSAMKKTGRKSKFEEIKKELKFSTTKRFELDQPSLDELADMRNQARRVVDKWMDFYRDTFKMSSPHLKNITSTPKIRSPFRRVNSAKDLENYKIINYRENDSTIQLQSYRCPSAPISHTAKVEEMEFLYPENSQSSLGQSEKDKKSKSKKKSTKLNDEDSKESLESIFARIHKTENRRKNKWMTLISNQQMCPISTRAEIENIVTNNKRMNCQHLLRCRCHKTKVPIIHDLEFDYFIQKVVPPHQLIIVYLTNSIYPKCCLYEEMLQKLHATANKNRAIPCLQSYKDDYRLFIYDIATANQTANRRSPLLLDRHNVVPGMTMIYKNKKLVFANNIFNGYGTAQSDFKKQVEICKMDNNYLPDDFRFQPSRGKTGFRTHWGGEMGGAGVDERGNPGIFVGPPVSHLRQSRTSWVIASLPPIMNSIVTSPKADCDPKSISVSESSSKITKKLADKSKSGKCLNTSTSIISMYSSVNSEDEKRKPMFLKPF